MKITPPFPYLLALVLFTSPGLTRAESKPADSKPVEKIDQGGLWKPGDGKADPAASPEARMRDEAIKRFDRNGDGKLDDAERADMEKARQQVEQNGGVARFRAQVLKLFDKDGDGVLNETERGEAEKFRLEQIKRFDKNKDGRLNDEERGEAIKAFVAEHPDKAPRHAK